MTACPACGERGGRMDTAAPLFRCENDGCPVETFRQGAV